MKTMLLAAIIVFAIQDDCGSGSTKKVAAATPQPTNIAPIRRFVLAQPLKDVAFDTQTGQICRTWDWSPTRPDEKTWTEVKIGQFAPTCLDLYNKFPTKGSTSVAVGEEN